MKEEKVLKAKIIAKGMQISVVSDGSYDDYLSLTDIAKYKSEDPAATIQNWMRSRDVIEFLGLWETLHNPDFKPLEFEGFKSQAGSNAFTLSPKRWLEATAAIGMYSKSGRNGGTFAHRDIAFEFASAISPVFKLYLIKEFQRLKEAENDLQKLEWDAKRFLSKNNYLIQTDAVKNYLIPVCNYREDLQWLPYAEEADLLNVALFGFTAKAWREANPDLAKKSNVKEYATINELTVLSNLESHNAQMIREGMDKKDRFEALKEIAEYQLRVLNEAEKISNRIEEQ